MSKKETLEEAAKIFYPIKTTDLICSPKLVRDAFEEGAKWQQGRSYSEEDLEYTFEQGKLNSNICYIRTFKNVLEILQFKKK